jgi:hypothetical protein
VLVVSNLNLAKSVQAISPAKFLESQDKGFTLNLDSDYRYLKTGYYVSMHAEILGNPVIPTSKSIIDASRTQASQLYPTSPQAQSNKYSKKPSSP